MSKSLRIGGRVTCGCKAILCVAGRIKGVRINIPYSFCFFARVILVELLGQ